MKRFQLFINKYYNAIKLLLLIVVTILGVWTLSNQLAINAEQAERRAEEVERITGAIKAETDRQTDIINRQFQALCILIIDTAGADALSKLDPQSEERCRDLARQPNLSRPLQGTDAPVKNPQPTDQRNAASNRESSGGGSPQPPAPASPAPPSEPAQPRITDPLTDVIERLTDLVAGR